MRIREFQEVLKRKKIGKVILVNVDGNPNSNFIYFSGVKDIIGLLVIPSVGQPVLYTTLLEYNIAKRHSAIRRIIAVKKLSDVLKKNSSGRIGIDFSNTSVKAFNSLKKYGAKPIDISEDIQKLRMTKNKEEIAMISKAASITSKIIGKAIAKASSRMTEKDLAHFIDSEIFNLGLKNSFPTIIASGRNSCNPHHVPSSERLKGFTIIDIGVIYNNYCSDMTRTIYVGKPSEREVAYYKKVLKVQEDCISMMGRSPKQLNDYAKKILGECFIHSLGHGIGLDVHEEPFSTYDKSLQDGMVITIEPGIYDKYGIRIEDDVLFMKKPIILTKFTKKLIRK